MGVSEAALIQCALSLCLDLLLIMGSSWAAGKGLRDASPSRDLRPTVCTCWFMPPLVTEQAEVQLPLPLTLLRLMYLAKHLACGQHQPLILMG